MIKASIINNPTNAIMYPIHSTPIVEKITVTPRNIPKVRIPIRTIKKIAKTKDAKKLFVYSKSNSKLTFPTTATAFIPISIPHITLKIAIILAFLFFFVHKEKIIFFIFLFFCNFYRCI
jgi:hypothetical protein